MSNYLNELNRKYNEWEISLQEKSRLYDEYKDEKETSHPKVLKTKINQK